MSIPSNDHLSEGKKASGTEMLTASRFEENPGLFDSVFHEVSNAIAIIAHKKSGMSPVIRDVNNHFKLITGFGYEDIRGRDLYDFMTGQNSASNGHIIENALNEGQAAVFSCFWKTRTGNDIDIDMTLRPYQTGSGETRFICVLREKKGAIRDYAAREVKNNLLAAMHHNFKTPLNGILGYSEVIMTEMLGPIGDKSYKNFARDIYGAGKDLLHLIDNLLDLKELESAEFTLREEIFPLGPMISGCLEKISPDAKKSRISLAAHIDPELSKLRGDKYRLQQILHCLLGNALKFTPAGGEICITAKLEKDGSCRITCQDNGAGMSPQQLAKAFNQEAPLSDIYSNPSVGIGFGLDYVKQFIEKHDGHVSITSAPGGGTAVTINLPACRLC